MNEILSFNNNENEIFQQNKQVIPTGTITYINEEYQIIGSFSDEVSLFRARKFWTLVMQDVFLLEKNHDFKFIAKKDLENNSFSLTCSFITACGRYAFWRMNNNQSPEARCVIESAYLPSIFQDYDEIINQRNPFNNINDEFIFEVEDKTTKISDILKKIIQKVYKKNKDDKKEE